MGIQKDEIKGIAIELGGVTLYVLLLLAAAVLITR